MNEDEIRECIHELKSKKLVNGEYASKVVSHITPSILELTYIYRRKGEFGKAKELFLELEKTYELLASKVSMDQKSILKFGACFWHSRAASEPEGIPTDILRHYRAATFNDIKLLVPSTTTFCRHGGELSK